MEDNVRKTQTDERSTALEQTNETSVSQQLRSVGTTPASLSEVAGLLISSSLPVTNYNLPQADHFYRYDVVEGETYTVENRSIMATLVIYICDASDGSDKTQCITVSPNHTDNFVASRNALYIGFHNSANSVDVTFSHIGFDYDIKNISPIRGTELPLTINKSLAQCIHFYRYDIVKGLHYTIKNLSLAASLTIYTSNTGDTSSSATKINYGTVASDNSMTFYANENARYIGFYNDANNVHVEITHENVEMSIISDKTATFMQYGGKSRVYLGKNIENGVNVLGPNALSAPNTLYILQYDYDLNEQTVSLGQGSSILFYGGSVSNGELDYSNGSIIPACDSFFGENLRVQTNEPVNIAWYGAKSGDTIDDIIDMLKGHTIIIPVGNYIFTKWTYMLDPGTMFIGEKVLNNDQTCSIWFEPANYIGSIPVPNKDNYIIGVNNNCGFKDITLCLKSHVFNGDLLRVDSAFWSNSGIPEAQLQALRAQQYYIDNVYFFTEWMPGGSDHYLATAFHVIVRDIDDEGDPLPLNVYKLSYRQHFENVEIKYFSTGICVELIEEENHTAAGDWGVWCNSLHFFNIDMWVRNNGFVLKTPPQLYNWAQGRFLISGILLQAVGTPDTHYPYAFYAERGHKCMLDKINAWDNSKVAYVGDGCISLGQYRADLINPLDVGATGKIYKLTWTEYSANNNQQS